MKKFALISHVLPPSPSGQAVMLYRILSCINEKEYYLVRTRSRLPGDVRNDNDKFRLLADHHFLTGEPAFNIPSMPIFSWFVKVVNFLLRFFIRARNILGVVRQESDTCAIVVCTGDVVDIPAGYWVSRICGIPFYAYIFDDYLYQFVGSERWLVKMIASFIFKHSAGVIGPNEFICQEYQQRYGVRAALVRNPCDKAKLDEKPYVQIVEFGNKIKIIYTGDVYLANYGCFRNLIRAMEMSQECSFELHIFTIRTPKKLSAEGIQGRNVFVHPPLSYDETLEQQRMSDVLFLPLEFESPIPEIIRTSAPGKLGEYLASGVPVLAHVPANSFVADYLDKYQCGLVANENDPLSLKDCLLRLVNDGELSRTITNNARQRALLDFDPCVSGKRLTEFIFGD